MIYERPGQWDSCGSRSRSQGIQLEDIPCEGFAYTTPAPCGCVTGQVPWVIWRFNGPTSYRIDARSLFTDMGQPEPLIAPVDETPEYCPAGDNSCVGYRVLPPISIQAPLIFDSYFVCTDVEPVFAIGGCTNTVAEALAIGIAWELINLRPGMGPISPN